MSKINRDYWDGLYPHRPTVEDDMAAEIKRLEAENAALKSQLRMIQKLADV